MDDVLKDVAENSEKDAAKGKDKKDGKAEEPAASGRRERRRRDGR